MEDWKDDILNSTKGMAKAQPPADAFDQILRKIGDQERTTESSRTWMGVAAAVSLIIMFNTYFIATYSSTTDSSSNYDAGSYSSLVTSYNLYENDK
ncbi:MAG: hypothetical protein ABJN36_10050 [Cyclobacteriaceae bacterium]